MRAKKLQDNTHLPNTNHGACRPHLDLLVADVVGTLAGGPLHGDEAQDLQQVVLHHVPDNAELVEVTTAALSPDGGINE